MESPKIKTTPVPESANTEQILRDAQIPIPEGLTRAQLAAACLQFDRDNGKIMEDLTVGYKTLTANANKHWDTPRGRQCQKLSDDVWSAFDKQATEWMQKEYPNVSISDNLKNAALNVLRPTYFETVEAKDLPAPYTMPELSDDDFKKLAVKAIKDSNDYLAETNLKLAEHKLPLITPPRNPDDLFEVAKSQTRLMYKQLPLD